MASSQPMKQSHLDLNLGVKRTRKQELLAQMELMVPWAALIAAPTSTKNNDKSRDPEMHSSKKGKQWYFGIDAESGLVHTVRGNSGHVSDIAHANALLHGQKTVDFGDSGYRWLMKNTLQLKTLFMLSDLWMVRQQLLAAQG